MAEEALQPNREITLNLGTNGTAFALGMLAGVIAGVAAVMVLMSYTKR